MPQKFHIQPKTNMTMNELTTKTDLVMDHIEFFTVNKDML